MSASVLIAYATRYGSTGEVAEAIGEALRARGIAVTVRRAREVTSLEGYGAVVLGSPLYIGSLLGEASKFLEQQRDTLARVPMAVFALGPLTTGKDLEDARMQLDGTLAKFPWLTPATTAVFVGKYNPAGLRFPDSMLAKFPASPLHGLGAQDGRDWDAIHAWAESLPEALHLDAADGK